MACDLKKIATSGHSYRWNKARRGLWTLTYMSRFKDASGGGGTEFLLSLFQNIYNSVTVARPPQKKKKKYALFLLY